MTTVSVLTVNYNTADMITHCVDSVLAQEGLEVQMIVLDNASQDNSLAKLSAYNDKIQVKASEKNLGFGKGNNVAAKEATGHYFYLLNPDAKLTSPTQLKQLCDYMDANPQYGLVGTALLDQQGIDAGRPKYHYQHERHLRFPLDKLPGDIAWLIGASVIIRADLFKQLGGFDEDFFLYGEDIDLCLRVRQAGFEIDYCSEIPVYHFGGGSERKTSDYKLSCKKHKALCLFCQKHYHPADQKHVLTRLLRRAKYRYYTNQLAWLLTRRPQFKARAQHYKAIIDTSPR
jgi:N-acetylglucosaminyl-diphospho-decaprenol L-rhamnosyltransferase